MLVGLGTVSYGVSIKKKINRDLPVVQCLRLHTSNAGYPSSSPDKVTSSSMRQQRRGPAKLINIKKKKNQVTIVVILYNNQIILCQVNSLSSCLFRFTFFILTVPSSAIHTVMSLTKYMNRAIKKALLSGTRSSATLLPPLCFKFLYLGCLPYCRKPTLGNHIATGL